MKSISAHIWKRIVGWMSAMSVGFVAHVVSSRLSGSGRRLDAARSRVEHPAKDPTMANVLDVANFFITMSQPDEGDFVTHLKLQKLLYYAQGFALVLLDRPLFDDAIEAWFHGPVVPTVYHEFKRYKSEALPMPEGFRDDRLSPEEHELLTDVWNVYGQFSAWKLRDMTHSEPPYKNAAEGAVISRDAMKDFFKTQVK